MKQTLRRGSLPAQRRARSVLLAMAADQERANRIRALKEAHPDVKWREIADFVGVSERSAIAWGSTGAIAHGNAARLTEFFQGLGSTIDDDFIWRGPRVPAPDLMAQFGPGDSVEDKLTRLLDGQQTLIRGLAEVAAELKALQGAATPARRRAA